MESWSQLISQPFLVMSTGTKNRAALLGTTGEKKSWGRGKSKKNSKMSQAKIKELVRKQIEAQAEQKFYGNVNSPTTVAHGGLIIPLTDPPLGMSDTQRIGDAIHLVKQSIGYILRAGSSPQCQLVRIIVVQWKIDTDAEYPTFSAVLSTYGGSSSSVTSPYNHDSIRSKKFGVLFDQTEVVGPSGMNNSTVVRTVNIPFTYVKRHVQFRSATMKGTNQLFMFVFSDDVIGGTDAPKIEYETMSTYTDM